MNARCELIEMLESIKATVVCWSIKYSAFEYEDQEVESILKKGYSDEEFQAELNKLDLEYDDGYGLQELFGVVLFDDNSWLERHEYDGSENWVWKRTPVLPECE
jgi:hypothetical protein